MGLRQWRRQSPLISSVSSAGQILFLSSSIGETQRNYTPEVILARSVRLISNLPLPTSVVPASSAGQIPYLSLSFHACLYVIGDCIVWLRGVGCVFFVIRANPGKSHAGSFTV